MASPPCKPLPATIAPPFLRQVVNLDTTISSHLHTIAKPLIPRFFFLLLEISADFRFFFPVALSLLLTPAAYHLRRPFLIPLILGSLLDLSLVGLIKFLVRRSRPLYNKNMSVAVAIDHFSFPSGHSSRVFYVAAFFYFSAASIEEVVAALRSNDSGGFVHRWIANDGSKVVSLVALIAWVWAATTSVSRVLLGRHFVFDVFAGACLGVLEALFVFHFLRF